MIIPVLVLVAILSVPLTGGRLSALADVRIRRAWMLFVALGVQILIIEIVPHWDGAFLAFVHVVSYLLAGGFVVSNWRVPGLVLIGAGGMANFAVIAANGGVMPATEAAQRTAGRAAEAGAFENSAVLDAPRLWFLGDIFAIPAGWPFANVFSIGDVLIVVGVFVALHRLCETRLAPRREPLFTVEV